MSEPALDLPSLPEWERLGVRLGAELHGGKQSRVFDATLDGQRVAIKLTNARLADASLLNERMRVVGSLAREITEVLAPVQIGGRVVQPVGEWLVTATAFVEGVLLDARRGDDAQLMGRSLALLHRELAQLEQVLIPPVTALDVVDSRGSGEVWQLLHGDFSERNLIRTPSGLRIFDFDDCGYGPVVYDLANSLYMVLFDSEINNHPERYRAFRRPFVNSYAGEVGVPVDDAAIDVMIGRRIKSLGRWLDDLSTAPIGIRTASNEWRQTLRSFVSSHSD